MLKILICCMMCSSEERSDLFDVIKQANENFAKDQEKDNEAKRRRNRKEVCEDDCDRAFRDYKESREVQV